MAVVHHSRLAEDGSKLAARSPVEAGDHSLVEVADRILAEAADHSLAVDAVVHNLAAVAGGIAVGHSHQEHHTAQVVELHTVLVAVLRSHFLVGATLFRPGCHTTSQLRPRAS